MQSQSQHKECSQIYSDYTWTLVIQHNHTHFSTGSLECTIHNELRMLQLCYWHGYRRTLSHSLMIPMHQYLFSHIPKTKLQITVRSTSMRGIQSIAYICCWHGYQRTLIQHNHKHFSTWPLESTIHNELRMLQLCSWHGYQ